LKKITLFSIAAIMILLGLVAFLSLRPQPTEAPPQPIKPPIFLVLEPLIVNLDGRSVVQLTVAFEAADLKAAEQLQARLPFIRNAILLLTAQRTAANMLSLDGKITLADDIHSEALSIFPATRNVKTSSKNKRLDSPIVRTFFTHVLVHPN
jgi:flagellar basal body-associated protein FliL